MLLLLLLLVVVDGTVRAHVAARVSSQNGGFLAGQSEGFFGRELSGFLSFPPPPPCFRHRIVHSTRHQLHPSERLNADRSGLSLCVQSTSFQHLPRPRPDAGHGGCRVTWICLLPLCACVYIFCLGREKGKEKGRLERNGVGKVDCRLRLLIFSPVLSPSYNTLRVFIDQGGWTRSDGIGGDYATTQGLSQPCE
jgi:hypothetical protein